MLRRAVMLGVLALICAGAAAYGVLKEAAVHSAWLNGVYAISVAVPSASMLLTLPSYPILRRCRKKRIRDLIPALCPALLNLGGMCAALVYYGLPAGWAIVLIPCLMISALLGLASLFLARLYIRL